MTNTIQTLADQINKFDLYYSQTAGHSAWMRWNDIEKSIKRELSSLSVDEMIELRKLITTTDDHLCFAFPCFADLPKKAHKAKLSSVMRKAWYYFKKGIYTAFSDCLRAAWNATKVTASMRKGIVKIVYRKATGEIRQASATLDKSHFTMNKKGVRSEPKPDAIKYFDLEKQAWRMFRIERLMSVA